MNDESNLQRRTVYRGVFFDVERMSWRGAEGKPVERDVVRHPGAVVIIPRLDDGTIALIRNFRPAIGDWLWELPAGKREADESPEQTARRELEEETGYSAAEITALGEFYTTPGMTDELMHTFLAEGLRRTEQNLEPWEQIEVIPKSHSEITRMAAAGAIRDGKTIVALHLYEQVRAAAR